MNNLDMYSSNPIWLSIGQSIPASIGAYLANGKVPIIITGDGGFQMLATTYSTMVKYKIPALILIIDNALYAIEQYLIDSTYFDNTTSEPLIFNKLNRWEYELFPTVFRGGKGFTVTTVNELNECLKNWLPTDKQPTIIACRINERELPIREI